MTRAAITGLLFAMSPALGKTTERAAPARHLRPPEHITTQTQAELKARMARHEEDMASLVRAVVLLDRPTIRALAGRIADDEVLARAGRSPHEPTPLSLPRDFFLQQTKLAVAARDLAAAVTEGADDATIGERFASVSSACIACHSAYLHGQPEAAPSDPLPETTRPAR